LLKELLLRFVIGGTVVCFFAFIGDLFKPKRFAGLFGAAPSVALATLSLTIVSKGKTYAAIETRSMIAGAMLSSRTPTLSLGCSCVTSHRPRLPL
jgi:hypothetical protein